jgi:hypothetical protein
MSETNRFTNSPVSSETGFLKRNWKSIRFWFAKRAFESKLERILRAAYGHEGNALPAGDRQYQLLNSQVDSICTEFADRWRINRELLRAQLPGLGKLARLAVPPPKHNWASLAGLLIVAIPLIFFLMGMIGGLARIGFHLIGER